MPENVHYKSGYVAILGRPNVGKSTLLNALLHFKLSIVTPKPQTTRHRVLGIVSGESFQCIFLDTPGFMEPHYTLHQKMLKTIHKALDDADAILFMIEASARVKNEDEEICRQLVEPAEKPKILVINKIDTVPKNQLLPLTDYYSKNYKFNHIIPVSALHEDGLDELQTAIVDILPAGSPFYPEDQITEHPERFFVAEIIREKIFQQYGDEIPYATTVQIEEFKERSKNKDFIKAKIIVERASQKAILIGKNGTALKKVGQHARKDIEDFLDRKVFLELWVTARAKWRSSETHLKEFGYN